jgi:hypothetical protein
MIVGSMPGDGWTIPGRYEWKFPASAYYIGPENKFFQEATIEQD